MGLFERHFQAESKTEIEKMLKALIFKISSFKNLRDNLPAQYARQNVPIKTHVPYQNKIY